MKFHRDKDVGRKEDAEEGRRGDEGKGKDEEYEKIGVKGKVERRRKETAKEVRKEENIEMRVEMKK